MKKYIAPIVAVAILSIVVLQNVSILGKECLSRRFELGDIFLNVFVVVGVFFCGYATSTTFLKTPQQ